MSAVRRLLRALTIGAVAACVVVPATAARAEPTPAQLRQQITEAQRKLDQVVEKYNQANEQLKVTQTKIDQISAQLAPLEANLGTAARAVGTIASSAYKHNGLGTVAAMTAHGTADDFLDGMGWLNHIGTRNERDIDAYNAAKGTYDAKLAELEAVRTQQSEQQKTLAEQKAQGEAEVKRLETYYTQLYGDPNPPPSNNGGGGEAPPKNASPVVAYAYDQLGACYDMNGVGNPCFDCSGLTMKAWARAGVSLPHSAAMQYNKYPDTGITVSNVKPGDLVFYNGLGHVAIAVGGGMVIHAATYGQGVKKSPISMGSSMPIVGIRRPR